MIEEDAVKVCVRLRPLISREKNKEHGDSITLFWKADQCAVVQTDGAKSFNFDRVFHSDEATETVYQDIAVPIIHSVVEGYNGTIFAYGQTASGKTYTMMGTNTSCGIIPQAIKDIFKIINENMNREFLLRISYMEIYNETVTDLLCDDRKRKPLEIREDVNRHIYVADLSEEVVVHPDVVLQWIKKGEKNRHYGETKMNERSSRSHTIFRMIIESRERTDPGNAENVEGSFMVSHLNLVDLAGSERASQTGAEGVRLKEGCNINRSLFTLGQVIKRLSDGQAGGFINYRDSKLTRILQTSLGGNAKTVIICTINPVSFDETLSTLQFASTAKHVKNTPHVNETSDEEPLLKRYRKEVLDLKKRLEELEASSKVRQKEDMAKEEHAQLLSEIKMLKMEKEDRMRNLTRLLVVPSSHVSEQDLRTKRKRRVTWAPGKLQDSLRSETVPDFKITSNMTSAFKKKARITDLPSLIEMDDSVGPEYSDFDDTLRSTVDEIGLEPEWNPAVQVFCRAKSAILPTMNENFTFESQVQESVAYQEGTSSGEDEKKMNVEDVENQLQLLAREKANEMEKRKALEETIIILQQQIQVYKETHETKSFEINVEDLKNQSHVLCETENKTNEVELLQKNLEVPDQLLVNQSENAKDGSAILEKKTAELVDVLQINVKENELENIPMPETQIQSFNTATVLEEKMPEQVSIESEVIKNIGTEESNDDRMCSKQDFMETIQLCEELMLEKKNITNELNGLRADFNNLVLDHENLKQENIMMEAQLREKMEINEFEALEKEAQKDHEAQLMHEIASLKKLVQNAEQFNQELENELEDKLKFLKEQENELAVSTKQVEQLQKRVRNMDMAASMGNTENLCEELCQMKQSFCDAEAVTRDAQKDTALLRSENKMLKENMDQLSASCREMEKDVQKYQSQLEAEKARFKLMQSDLQKELQYAFNENTKLNSLMDGRVPKGVLCHVELEKKIIDLTEQLEKANEENVEQLKNRVSSLMGELEEKTAKEEQLLNENEKMDLVQKKLSIEVEELQQQLMASRSSIETAEGKELEVAQKLQELQEKLSTVTEEKDELCQIHEELQAERDTLKENIMQTTEQVSSLMGELEAKTAEQEQLLCENEKLDLEQKKLSKEVEQLQEQLDANKSSLAAAEGEKLEIVQKFHDLQEKISTLTQEKDELHQIHERVRTERDQLKDDINENIELSIEIQNDLRITQEDLKQQKQLVSELRVQIAQYSENTEEKGREVQTTSSLQEKLSSLMEELQKKNAKEILLLKENQDLHEAEIKLMSELGQLKERLTASESVLERTEGEKYVVLQQLLKLQKEFSSLTQERDELQQTSEALEAMKSQFEGQTQEHIHDLTNSYYDKWLHEREELDQSKMALLTDVEHLKEALKMSQLGSDVLKENIEVQLEEKLKASIFSLQTVEREKSELTQKVGELQELLSILSQGKNDLLQIKETLQVERDQLQQDIRENTEQSVKIQDELRATQEDLKQQKQLVNELRMQIAQFSETIQENSEVQEATSLQEKLSSLMKELKQNTAEQEHHLCEKEKAEQMQQKLTNELAQLQETLTARESMLKRTEDEKLEVTQKLQRLQEELCTLTQERNELQQTLQAKRNELTEAINKNVDISLKAQEELRMTQEDLKEQKELVAELRIQLEEYSISIQEKTREFQAATSEQEKLSSLLQELKQKIAAQEECFLEERKECDQSQKKLAIEIEQLQELLKTSRSSLEMIEGEKLEVIQELREFQETLTTVTQAKDELQKMLEILQAEKDQLKEDIKKNIEQATKQNEDFEQLKSQLLLKREEENGNFQTCVSENKVLKETLNTMNDATTHLEAEKASLLVKVQECETQKASLAQEAKQFQELLERLRAEREKICLDLQEKSEMSSQLLSEKLRKESDLENHIASQDQQLELLCQNLQEEKMKNDELSNHIYLLEKEISVLQSKQNEKHSSQTEIEIARLISFREERNQQLQELMEKYLNSDAQHSSFLSGITSDFCKDVECQKEVMVKAKEFLSSTLSRQFTKLQDDRLRLNTDFQTILYKHKFICRNVALKEAHCNIIKDYEKDLANEKKIQDELVLQIENIKSHSPLWSESACQQFRNDELKSLKESVQRKEEFIKKIMEEFSELEHDLTNLWANLQQEINNRKNIMEFLKECTNCNFDATALCEKIQQENKRISQVVQLESNTLQRMMRRRTQWEIRMYFNGYETELKDKKEQTEELKNILKQLISSAAVKDFEEETYRLYNQLKAFEQEQKEMQMKIQRLENDLCKAKADSKLKEETATVLQKQLDSKTAEHELKELKTKVVEKDCHIERLSTEKKGLQAQLDKGSKQYLEEIGNLKTQLVRLEMEKTKESKLTDQEITSLKSCLEDKEENIRKLKEQLRRAQQAQDTSILPERAQPHPSNVPLTCGGGSGIIQSTAMLVLKSEKAQLERDLAQLQKRYDHHIRQESLLRDEHKKWKEKAVKSVQLLQMEVPHKHLPMSPKKTEISVIKTDNVSSHLRELSSEETLVLDSPKSKVSDLRTKSLPISCSIQFFDNSSFATLPDAVHSENTPEEDPIKEWWTVPDKTDAAPECKTS